MRRVGWGLKPLIALNLVVVIGLLGLLLAYASIRLSHHALTSQMAGLAQIGITRIAQDVTSRCPKVAALKECPDLSSWLREQQNQIPALKELWVVDSHQELVLSSDPSQSAQALWGAFAADRSTKPVLRTQTFLSSSQEDFEVQERKDGRVLLVGVPLGTEGWQLKGMFSLAESDRTGAGVSRSIIFYSTLLSMIMVFMGFVLLYRLMVRPLDRLLQSADRISEGDLTFLLSADRGSELGRLGFSFQQMARKIAEDKLRMKEQIEELKRLNRDLHQTQQSLIRSEKLASVGRLAAGLAHEVGNPMSAILGYVGMLRSDWEKIERPDKIDILIRVEKEVERIDKVIKDLLAYSRPGRGQIREIAPSELLENAMVLIRPQKKFKQIQFQVDVGAETKKVVADPDLTRQVLVNLILNALDAGREQGHIWIRSCTMGRSLDGTLLWPGCCPEPAFFQQGELHRIQPPHDGKNLQPGQEVVVFSVVDDGLGIEEVNLPRIFDPFFTTKEPGRGTGLGLAICHAGVSAMGGEIWVYSRVGVGTQLAFYLPVAKSPGDTNECAIRGTKICTD